jgi:hypothetical protein
VVRFTAVRFNGDGADIMADETLKVH